MCGIWGVVNGGSDEMATIAEQALHHRGPDDAGCYVAVEPLPVALVNTRLAIIDLSPGGHQPMVTPDGRYWIVYNGEVFNFADTRQLLQQAGHQFSSNSDTEVILHAYAEWGEKCLEHLRGMFALAIWDTHEASLFLARDRLGIKPLYYTQLRGQGGAEALAFASELKTLLATGLVEPSLNYTALHHYLSFYAVPAPYSMLDGVEMLPPGHYLTYKEGRVQVKQYWSIPAYEPLPMSQEDITARLRELLEESIRLRMIADVPVGAFLSGGIDSSAVVALMTRISGERLKTFSIGFGDEGQELDERSGARLLAGHYGTDHTEVVVTGRMVRDQLDAIIRAMDQPSGDGLNTYFVSQATAKHVKVALSGLGGDELFAGYPQFKMFRQASHYVNLWRRLPGIVRGAARGVAGAIKPLRRGLKWLDGEVLDRYERVRVLFNEQQKPAFYSPDTLKWMVAPESSLKFLSRYVHPAESDPVVQVMRLELMGYMAHTLLRDTDAMSMAHSLEVRVPLIDHRLVEFAARIPPDLKLRDGRTKWIFAHALRDVLPPEVLQRPKQGFEMPVAAWLRRDLRDVLDDVFSTDSLARRGLFQVEAAQQVYQDFLANEQRPYMYCWSLAALELWMRQFVDQPVRV